MVEYFKKLKRTHPFFIRLFHVEFWPMNVLYFPVFFYYLWLSAKARSFFFFTAANPGIETGGMLGESKINILNKIPTEYKPLDIFIPANTSFDIILNKINHKNIHFPVVIKPDIGERGLLVEKINTKHELKKYWERINANVIIQEFVDFEVELALLYFYHPDGRQGEITSVTQKEFLTITGNGSQTVQDILSQNMRGILQLPRLEKEMPELLARIPAHGEILEIEPIGNHCRGTKFLNTNHLIDDELTNVFDKIIRQIDGVYFGRFDLKCKSIEDLKRGKNIRIVELNGVGAEPAHIYDPDFPFLNIFKELFKQWKIIYKISTANKKRGLSYMTISEMWDYYKEKSQYYKTVKSL